MWARSAWRLASLLVATLGCTQPNAVYRRGVLDSAVPSDRGREPTPVDGMEGVAPVPDAEPPPPDDAGTPPLDVPITVEAAPADLPPAEVAPAEVAPETAPADLTPDLAEALPPLGEQGLLGSYFDGTQLENGTPGCLDLQRVDKVVDWNWPNNVRPGPNMDHDNFSVRWTGELVPLVSGIYTFTTRTDDGVRLYLNDEMILGNWTVVGATTQSSGPKMLNARQRYTIRMEYRESTNAAVAQLSWTPPMQGSQVIPQDVLFAAPRVQLPVKPGCKPTPP